uniref:Uncharacterized protein n=1 Tax=Arundo donax TaxID=35708 RepID=A0A0A8ZNB8_ARUDO
MFDKDWQWNLRRIEDYQYLVRFPQTRSCLRSCTPNLPTYKLIRKVS